MDDDKARAQNLHAVKARTVQLFFRGSQVWTSRCGQPGVDSQVWTARCGQPDVDSQVWAARCRQPDVGSQVLAYRKTN